MTANRLVCAVISGIFIQVIDFANFHVFRKIVHVVVSVYIIPTLKVTLVGMIVEFDVAGKFSHKIFFSKIFCA